jgi:hypothetical protein
MLKPTHHPRRRRIGLTIAAVAAMVAAGLQSSPAEAEPADAATTSAPVDRAPGSGAGGRIAADGVALADDPASLAAHAEVLTPSAIPPDGAYTPITPTRFYDSRTDGGGVKFGPKETRTIDIAGRFGLPAAGQIKAIAVNITVAEPTAVSFVTVYPTGLAAPPNVSSVNFQPGRVIPNLLIVNVGGDGRVNVVNDGGQSHVLLDVVGFFSTATGPSGSGLVMFADQTRTFDSRPGGVAPNGSFGLSQGDGSPYPADYTSVILNATNISPTPGFSTFYTGGAEPPNASNLNFPGVTSHSGPEGLVVSNSVFANLNASGTYTFIARAQSQVQLIVDQLGRFDSDGVFTVGAITYNASYFNAWPTGPERVWDSRFQPTGPLLGGSVFTLDFTNVVPAETAFTGVYALVLNLTIDSPTASTYLSAFPYDQGNANPDTSTLNFAAGQAVAHSTIVYVDSLQPLVSFFMPFGQANFIVDLQGWFEYDDSY